ncbi:hypothetical protein ASF41_10600 [Methylobacterium sp. Leaf111]|nr:hypothetical protein ASF41_10600 [Methylobacterium sp. Leaf111]
MVIGAIIAAITRTAAMVTSAGILAGGIAITAGIITAVGKGVVTITTVADVTTTDRSGFRCFNAEPAPAYPAIRSRTAGVRSTGVGSMR